MGLNVLLKKISPIEKEILEVWKEAYPSAAYTYGFNDFAGKILIPSKENIARLKKQIKNLRKKTKNKGHLKFLGSCYVDLDFYEPYRVPSTATNAFFYHLVKEGIHVQHMKSLASLTCEALKQARIWLVERKWPIEIRIITKQKTNGLIGVLNKIKGDNTDASLKQELEKVIKESNEYIKSFPAEGVEEGDFTEVFPILQKHGGDIGHKKAYPKILKNNMIIQKSQRKLRRKRLNG